MKTTKINFKLFYFIFFTFFFTGLHSQEFRIRHLTTLDGLNNGTINDIVQDSTGNMWFSTWDGLMRYDGYSVRNYKPVLGDSTSIASKRCRELFCDSRGNLWVQNDYGVSLYDETYDIFRNFSFSEDYVREFIQKENLLFFNTNNEIYLLDLDQEFSSDSFKKIKISGLSFNNNILNSLVSLDSLFVLITSPHGGEGSVIYYAKFEDEQFKISSEYKLNREITASCIADKDNLYYATRNGLHNFNIKTGKSEILFRKKFKDNVDLLLKDDVGNIWSGSRHGGLIQYRLIDNEIFSYNYNPEVKNTILSDVIFSLYEDFSGNLWIGHGGYGISLINLNQKQFYSYSYNPFNPNTIRSNTVVCFNETDEEILIGNKFSGLEIWNKNKNHFKHIKFDSIFNLNLREYVVWHIFKEDYNTFWLGTNFGLVRATKQNGEWYFERFMKNAGTAVIRQIYIDPKSNIWVGSYNGLYLIPFHKRKEMEWFHYTDEDGEGALSDNVITAILLDDYNNFWIGTQQGGLNLLEKNFNSYNFLSKTKPELKFRHFVADADKKNSLNENEINCLVKVSKDQIWVGTQGGGINIINPGDFSFRYINEGLPGQDVFGVLRDPAGYFWISTNNGISRYYPGNETEQFVNYKPSDGIQGNVFMVNSFYKSYTGELYFGGRHGFTVFYPEKITGDSILPKVSLGEIKINNEVISIGEEYNNRKILPKALFSLDNVHFTHKENTFSIEVKVHQYSNPEKNEVQYRLLGLSDSWNKQPASRRYIDFSNMPPGSYTLEVIASNSDGLWTKEPVKLDIKISPPWYGTLLFKLFMIFLILSVAFLIIQLLLHRQNLKHSLKLEKLERQKINEINEAKLRFFTDISHDLKTPLTLITAPVESIFKSKDFSEANIKKHFQVIYKNSHRLLALIEQLLSFRKLSTGKLSLHAVKQDIVKFIKETLQSFEGLQNDKEINLTERYEIVNLHVWFDPLKMEQILYNLFSNAFKYTGYNGSVYISAELVRKKNPHKNFSAEISWVKISVRNDGVTIPDDKLEKIFERFYQVDENHGGSGIGLSLTKSLIELHHGFIEVSSDPESGVCFSFYIPETDILLKEEEKVHDVSYRLNNKPQTKIIKTTLGSSDFIRKNDKKDLEVLLVEDNKELCEFFNTTLSPFYNFRSASNGEEGLKIARENIPDVIISDIMMPKMNGYIFCRKIKESIKTCHIPVILLTARSSGEDQIRGYESGADAYVVKPFDMEILTAQIERLIENRQVIQKKFREKLFINNETDLFHSKDESFINVINNHIEANITDPNFNVNTLSDLMNLSTTQIYRKLKALTGSSPIDYISNYKIQKSCLMLRQTDMSVKEICYHSGFNNPSYFCKSFKQKMGISPQRYRYQDEQNSA